MIFERRTNAPKKSNEFYYSNKNVFVESKYGMPNCTCYALGRYAELTGVFLPIIKGKARGNAEDWYDVIRTNGKFEVSDKPRLGAVVCWKCGEILNGKDGAGHVAVVEKIENNGDIVCSNSAYNGTNWYEQTFKASQNYAWTSSKTGKKYELQGFILPPVDLIEKPRTAKVKYFCPLRSGAGHNNQVVCTVRQNTTFALDGQYDIIRNVKWVHGTYTAQNNKAPFTYSGWIEATNI